VGVAPEWASWCKRWYDTSTLAPQTRRGYYYELLKAGRWLQVQHPEIVRPDQWTREIAAGFVAAIDRAVVGQWANGNKQTIGKPYSATTKDTSLGPVRTFFLNLQEWNWILRRFDPCRSLATPRSVLALIGPSPRVISDDIWAKLLWAGLNVGGADLPRALHASGETNRQLWYPLEMVRAIAMVWLFAGLRSDEIRRLRVGCVRWQHGEVLIQRAGGLLPKDAVCLLEVPVNKTSGTFTKPVDPLVGEAVLAWEKLRPEQPPFIDPKTAERVHYLFAYRGKAVGKTYINKRLIPILCKKAGVPREDASGPITSHRARSTIATQLFNAKEPMSLFELQEWLGHRWPSSTQQYAKITPTRLARSYADAEYFKRNVRTIEVLIDQEAIKSGAAAAGQPYLYYDLGHGYCKNDFFVECPHRMACARCAFYEPKKSSKAQVLEAQASNARFLQEIPLTDAEREAVDGDRAAMAGLLERLADVPTPEGPTPRELANALEGDGDV
jgi:integrase